ncbi:protein-tyrosine-phosphatase [Actinoplanes philippinensis]|uniref:Tyrosine phosphatase family protein n=1 Tax=Actinoplanes philippinensis TaxID=35752 RepID=A0A1I2L606_9ACTN|nr:tyrosine-protein phosphatase [Actinoplanes philippinensis]GIE80664.1 protein-tyrosine-phosphatase [Actinoplanes philippinensis]SFF72887.1 Tyrosine phosphatase family protein [Actinoplanes philippinensis]
MDIDRHLDWAGCHNVRDLGGLPTVDGRLTRRGSVVRADSLDRLTADGWAALHAYGVRTVVDLREDDERAESVSRPDGITVVPVALDDNDDTAYWYDLIDDDADGTPLYYRSFLEHKADRCVAALTAVARAAPGGVVVHCGIGRDRTGLIALLLLALAGVRPEAIAADYALSEARLRAYFEDDREPVAERLAEHGTTIAEVIHALLDGFDTGSGLALTPADRAAIRARLLGD